jgi:hypothetical protein
MQNISHVLRTHAHCLCTQHHEHNRVRSGMVAFKLFNEQAVPSCQGHRMLHARICCNARRMQHVVTKSPRTEAPQTLFCQQAAASPHHTAEQAWLAHSTPVTTAGFLQQSRCCLQPWPHEYCCFGRVNTRDGGNATSVSACARCMRSRAPKLHNMP